MASAHQPQQQQQTPSNPFDGFDAYSGVAAPPPASSSVPPTPVPAGNAMIHPMQQQPPLGAVQQQPPMQPDAASNNRNTWSHPQQAMANPFGNTNQGVLIPSAVQANPYALTGGLNQPPQQFPQQQPFQQGVVSHHQSFVQQQQQMVHVGATNAWAVAPVAPGVMQTMPPATPAATNQQLVTAPPSDDPFGIFEAPSRPQPTQPPATPQQHLEKQMQTLNFNNNDTPGKNSVMPDEDDEEGLALIDVELDEDDTGNNQSQFEGNKQDEDSTDRESEKKEKPSGSTKRKDKNSDIAPPPPMPPGRENAEYLSQNSGAIKSPLPRPSLVVHAGYVLSRISFRTVLMRKWKQTFWIQYGPTQLLFFRSYSDFGDWLNNPYHSAKAREYLVKLRVDFVSDLQKKSVMGYQVTQIRRKPYGKNVMLHFKLERWMDYGPTIAAAFAARQEEMIESDYYKKNQTKRAEEDGGMNTTNDVSALRKIILGCMRNARDAALLASQERVGSPTHQPEFQGRYAEDATARHVVEREEEGSPEKFHAASQSSKAGLYHQAFAAESSVRRKFQGDMKDENDNSKDASDPKPNKEKELSAVEEAPAPIVDLLG